MIFIRSENINKFIKNTNKSQNYLGTRKLRICFSNSCIIINTFYRYKYFFTDSYFLQINISNTF